MRDHERVYLRAHARIVFKEMSGGETESMKEREKKRRRSDTHFSSWGSRRENLITDDGRYMEGYR